ncbi:MAG: NAD(+)/NADH kinase [Firmicutes bacterium]|jgi:NAD+ kinase|nr:NAD(+)/NADH kinase [Bacillota bacterium]
MKRVGVWPNLEKRRALSVTLELLEWLGRRGVKAVVAPHAAGAVGRPVETYPVAAWASSVEFVVALGGDGTILDVAKQIAPAETPILGVNLGHLGFLTEIELPELYDALPRFLRGEYFVEERMMLNARVVNRGETKASFLVLNEAAITKGPFARMIALDLYINEKYVDTYPADGLIVSTPTGSTAYSLSAGGPIVSPAIDVIVITPICPHTLYSRSLVVSRSERVRVAIREPHEDTLMTLDGQKGYTMQPGDEIAFSPADEAARLLRVKGWSFYEVLRKKMKEGSMPVRRYEAPQEHAGNGEAGKNSSKEP